MQLEMTGDQQTDANEIKKIIRDCLKTLNSN